MEHPEIVKAAACIAVGIVMGLGSLGPSLGQGLIGSKAVESIGKYAENASIIRNTMFVALTIAETSSIYCVVIAGFLLYIIYAL